MPITFNEANDFWELTNPSDAEKQSLTKIAIAHITDFFGDEVSNRILQKARAQAEQEQAQTPAGTFQTGGVGNA